MELITRIRSKITNKEFIFICMFSIMCVFNYFMFNQFDVMFYNQAEFGIGVSEVVWAFTWRAVVIALVFIIVLTALSCTVKKVFPFVIAVILGFTAATYAQVLFMNKVELMTVAGTMSRETPFQYAVNTIVYCLLILLPAVVVFIEKKKKKSVTPKLAILLSIVIFGMQTVGVVSAAAAAPRPAKDNELYYFSVEEQLKLSTDENIIVFLLDRFDTDYTEAIFGRHPETKDIFDGFTYYTNNVSEYPGTFPSVTSVLTGRPFDPNTEEQMEYLQDAWSNEVLFRELKEKNYRVSGLMDSIATFYDFKDLDGKFDNISTVKPENRRVRNGDFYDAMLSFAQIRQSPDLFKEAFRNEMYLDIPNYCIEIKDTDDYFPRTISAKSDLRFYDKLKSDGLSVHEGSNFFSFVHLQSSHNPYLYDQDLQPPKHDKNMDTHEKAIMQTRGTFKILNEYFTQMKQLGIYENSTIIIMGDHGTWSNGGKEIIDVTTTALLIKEKGKGSGALITDETCELSNSNFQSTILELIGSDEEKILPSYFDVIASGGKQRPRYFYNVRWTNLNSCTYICTFAINGDAREIKNWTLVD